MLPITIKYYLESDKDHAPKMRGINIVVKEDAVRVRVGLLQVLRYRLQEIAGLLLSWQRR